MKRSSIATGIASAILLFVVIATIVFGSTGWTPSREIRPLAKFYLENCFNVFNKTWWTASPEVVTSMLWDYRGIDTYYETSVFFLAVIGATALFRVAEAKLKTKPKEPGLSLIVKTVTKLIFPLIIVVATSIALRGELTPGGGFQAGSILAIVPLLLMAAFSRHYIEENIKLTRNKCLALIGIGLIAIVTVIATPLIAGAALMQNQAKPWSPFFSYPEAVGPLHTSGTLFFLDVAEFITVGAGFTLLFLLLSIPEEEFKRLMRL